MSGSRVLESSEGFRPPSTARPGERTGAGPFVSRLTWRHPDGSTAVWESRVARRRGYIVAVTDGTERRVHARPTTAVRLIRVNVVASVSFIIGGALFTIGALLAQLTSADAFVVDTTFLVGGVFFSLGGYSSIVLEVNSPRALDDSGGLAERPWRWWAYEPMRLGWVSAFVLFVGTLAFFLSLVRAYWTDLDAQQVDRLLWAPEMIGCLLFLVSGQVALAEVCHAWFRWLPRSLGWWVASVNQLGSILFFVSGVAGFIRPATGSVVDATVVNWGTALGALCFSIAGVLQLFERPPSPG